MPSQKQIKKKKVDLAQTPRSLKKVPILVIPSSDLIRKEDAEEAGGKERSLMDTCAVADGAGTQRNWEKDVLSSS